MNLKLLTLISAAVVAAQTSTVSSNAFPVPTQDPNDLLPLCYPDPNICNAKLQVVEYGVTAGGFKEAPRGFNTYGMQANKISHNFLELNQGNVTQQCDVLASNQNFVKAGYNLCSLDAKWNTETADEYGRVTYNTSLFDLPKLADHLHSQGMQLGVYIVPGVEESAFDKKVKGTDILIKDIVNANAGDGIGISTYDFDYTKDGVQQWHDSQVELWADWGVDFIKLDFVTPGSPSNGAALLADNSPCPKFWRRAIDKVGRKMHLGLSWKLCRNSTYYDAWASTSDAIRIDQDINNSGATTFTNWQVMQRLFNNYRQFITLQVQRGGKLALHPDMDNLYVANSDDINGVTAAQKTTMANHYMGAGSHLITGSDLTMLDDAGVELLTSQASIDYTEFCSFYPMQVRNPGSGCTAAQQLQSWIAGPNPSGEAYVMLVNYGPDGGNGGFGTQLAGNQTVSVSLSDMGLSGSWTAVDVRSGSSTEVRFDSTSNLTAILDEGASILYKLQSS